MIYVLEDICLHYNFCKDPPANGSAHYSEVLSILCYISESSYISFSFLALGHQIPTSEVCFTGEA